MKKILFTVAALGLGLGLAATVASAEMSFSATGKYEVQGFYVSEGSDSAQGMQVGVFDKNLRWETAGATCDGQVVDGICFTGYDTQANDMWHHSLYIFPQLKVNDNVSLKSEIRMIDRDVWGTNQATGAVNTASDENMRLRLLWMDYASPVGTWSVGRILGGGWGSKFLDSTGNRDRIKWNTNFMPENWGLTFIYQKNLEVDAFDGGTDEADSASYYVGTNYKADFGQTDIAFWHNRIDKDAGDYDNTEFWANANYKFGGFNILSEFNWAFAGNDAAGNDLSSMGFMADVNTQLEAFTIGGLFFWLQGDMDFGDGDNEGYIGRNGVGNDYNPFAIATGDYMGLLNGDKNGYLGAVSSVFGIPGYEVTDLENYSGGEGNPGAMALAAYAMYQFNEKLSFNGAAGYVWADKTPDGVDDAMGFEVDLGLSYKLLDNLTYSATFAYMAPGDMFHDLASIINTATEEIFGESTGTNNIYLLLHNLTMTF
jgi:hypothetical protein